MRLATTATIVTAAVLLTPSAALGARPNKTKTTAQASANTTTRATSATTTTTSTTPASVPTTTITTTGPGVSSTTLPLAPPRPTNFASGRVALNAYASYLQSLVDSESTGQANDAAFANTVEFGDSGESGCRSDLEPLTQGAYAVKPAVQDTLKALGREIGDDLAISYDEVALTPLGRLATVLERLKWVHGGRNADVIANYVKAETALIALPQSGLCQDVQLAASALEASKPAATPADTRAFIAQYDTDAKAASAALGGFLVLLRAYSKPAERPLLERIATLAGEFATDSKTSLLATGQALTTSLETS